eukprot:Clim_evm12s252 gene=Clim_evmTU12s252
MAIVTNSSELFIEDTYGSDIEEGDLLGLLDFAGNNKNVPTEALDLLMEFQEDLGEVTDGEVIGTGFHSFHDEEDNEEDIAASLLDMTEMDLHHSIASLQPSPKRDTNDIHPFISLPASPIRNEQPIEASVDVVSVAATPKSSARKRKLTHVTVSSIKKRLTERVNFSPSAASSPRSSMPSSPADASPLSMARKMSPPELGRRPMSARGALSISAQASSVGGDAEEGREAVRRGFEELAKYFPALKTEAKSSRLVILRKTTDKIRNLRSKQDRMEDEYAMLLEQQRLLTEKLVRLKEVQQ